MLSNSYSLSSYDYRPVFRSFSVSESFFLVSNPCSSTPWIWNCNWGTMVNHLITGILLTSESFISTNKHSNMVYIHYGNTWIQFLLPNHASIGSSVDVAGRKKKQGETSLLTSTRPLSMFFNLQLGITNFHKLQLGKLNSESTKIQLLVESEWFV